MIQTHGVQIAVFAFNRPKHLEMCLESLKNNPEATYCDLTVFIDGPRNNSDEHLVNEVYQIAKHLTGFQSVNVVKSESNKGLATSIINGVDKIFESSSEIIVLEDDLIVSPYFLNFMSNSLEKYRKEINVASIHGYLPNLSVEIDEPFFLRGADCWGWATWRDRWATTEWNGIKLRDGLIDVGLVNQFNLDGGYNYFGMLERQIRGENDSWAIRWHASMFLQNRLTFYPSRSLVINTGMDGTGRHSSISKKYDTQLSNSPIYIADIEISENLYAREALKAFFTSNSLLNKTNIVAKSIRKIRNKLTILRRMQR
jgi:hypothetical protein